MTAQLASIQALIIDMDGVLWRGAQALPGGTDLIEFLSQNSIRFLLATNNATRTPDYVIQRMAGLGVAVTPQQVLTSAGATARYLEHELPTGSRVLVIGEEALYRMLAEVGFQTLDPSEALTEGRRAVAVVVGLDRAFTYEKLQRAVFEIRAGARFIATNGDVTFPAEHGLVPGTGSIVAAVQAASGVTPTIIGKPYRPMFDTALEILKTPRERMAMLGDRLDTDIEGGQAAGLATILVLTGVTTAAEAQASPLKPDFTFPNLIELRKQWAEELRVHMGL
jgi:HAD superfamily hydrolase (TIGR01457 family)